MQAKLFIILLTASVVLFSIVRIFFGIDLGDESLYATFAAEWLKRGMAQADNLSIAQTATFLVYPFIWLYAKITGGTAGLILFMRFLFLGFWAAAATGLYRYFRKSFSLEIALGAACAFFLFLPFNLPAASYNTIAIAMVVLAVTWYCQPDGTDKPAGILSGAALALAVTAYPALITLSFVWAAVALFQLKKTGNRTALYFIVSHALTGLALLLAFSLLLGTTKLLDIAAFMSALLHTDAYLVGKWQKALDGLILNKFFSGLMLLAIMLGAALRLKPQKPYAGLIALICAISMACLCVPAPALFTSNHDVAAFLILFGFGFAAASVIAARPALSLPLTPFMLPFLLFVLTGLVFVYFSNNGLMNFPVGAIGAAIMVIALIGAILQEKHQHDRIFACGWMGFVLALFVAMSLSYFYGELAPRWTLRPWERIEIGVFKNLSTNPAQARFINSANKALARMDRQKGDTFTMFGRLSALYLMTSKSPRSLNSWQMEKTHGQKSYDLIRTYLERHHPDFILRYTDPWTAALQDFQLDYLKNYTMIDRIDVEYRHLEIWRAKSLK